MEMNRNKAEKLVRLAFQVHGVTPHESEVRRLATRLLMMEDVPTRASESNHIDGVPLDIWTEVGEYLLLKERGGVSTPIGVHGTDSGTTVPGRRHSKPVWRSSYEQVRILRSNRHRKYNRSKTQRGTLVVI